MAVIKLKRIQAERGSQTINAGELAIAGTKLYYGGADIGVNATGITPTQVAGTNISNIFTQQNTFSGAGTTISIVDGNGNENYRVENGRLVAMYPSGFAFNQNDLVDRSYVDASAQGLKPHASVKAASTANITIGAAPATLDGITLIAGDRLLLKNQATASENGIYVFNGVGVALTRAADMDAAWDDEVFRAYVFVDEGSTQENSSWVTSVGKGGTVDSTAITWAQFSVVGGAVADEISLTKTANVFSIKDGAVTPGDFTVDGQLTIGTAGGTWSIDGSGADMVFTGGSYTATLPAPTATRTTIAYTSDLPAGVDVISCATAAATAQKDINVANYAEADGKQLYIDFTNANTAASPTLKVNALAARAIYISGAAAANGSWAAGDVLRLAFDAVNNRYHILENLTTRQYYGNAATTTKLATARSLKVALGSTTAVTFDGSAAQDSIPVSGTLPIANGGTGQTTANAAFNALSPMTTIGDIIYGAASGVATRLAGNTTATNKFLRSVSSGIPSWEAVTKADVGLSVVENTALSTWAGTSNITTLGTVVTGTWGASTIAVNKGGTGQTSYTDGQLLIGNTTGNTLAKATLTATTNQTKITNGAGSITVGLADNIVTAGTVQTGGELTVGTAGGSWSIDGSAVDKMIFTGGSYTATLPQPTAIRHTIAYTTDIPAGVNVVQCSTPTATAAKVVNVDNFSPADGKQLYIDFDNANTAAATFSATNGTNPLSLYLGPTGTGNPTWGAGEVLRIEYRQGTPSAWYILENLTTGQYYGNAATASVATKLGTSTVGLTTQPIYLNAGTPTAITTIGVGYGGTGTSTAPTSGGVIYASSTTAYASTPLGAAGKILRSNGTIPEWSAPTFPNTAPSAGKFMVGDGTNWIESTSTIPGNATAANSGKYLTVNGSGNYAISTYTLSLGSNTTINAAAGAGYAAYYSATGALSGEQYLSVGRGGTGAGTFAANAILIGNGTSAISAPGPTLTSSVMTFAGAGTLTSGAASAMNITAGTTGKLTLNSGTTGGIDIGTGANAKTITIGNTTAGTAINLTSPLTTVSGELNVGTGGGSWSIDGLTANKLRFNYGTQIYELPNDKVAGTYTIATTADVPSTLTIYQSDTAAATTPKTLTVADIPNFTAVSGIQLFVKFTNANTAAATQITIDGVTTALNLNGDQVSATNTWTGANQVLRIEYNGTSWDILENLTSRQYYGNAATVTNGVYTNTTQPITGTKTFNNSALKLLGSSTGATTFTSANSGSTDYTITIPAATGTLATINNTQTFTAAQTFRAANSIRAEAASTQDAIILAGRAGGTSSYAVTLTPTTLTASRTLTLPDAAGTIALVSQIPSSFTISASSDALVASGGANSVSMNVATAVTAGKFYRHATNPTATTGSEVNPLKYEGWFYATQFEGVIDGGTTW